MRVRGGLPPRAKVVADLATAELMVAQFTTAQAHVAIGNLSAGDTSLIARMGLEGAGGGGSRPSALPRRTKDLPGLDVDRVERAKKQRQVCEREKLCVLRACVCECEFVFVCVCMCVCGPCPLPVRDFLSVTACPASLSTPWLYVARAGSCVYRAPAP